MTASGQCVESDKVKGTFKHLRYSPENMVLAGITRELSLIVFSVDGRGVPTKVIEAKLSAQGLISSAVWCPEGILATCSQEMSIRFWNCLNEDNAILSVKDHLYCTEDTVISDIGYNSISELLAVGTNNGQVAMWKRVPNPPVSNDWSHVTTFNAEREIASIQWSGTKNLLAINMSSMVKIVSQREAVAVHSDEISAVQVSPTDVFLQTHSAANSTLTVKTDLLINGIAITNEHMVVWSETQVAVFSIHFDKGTSRQTVKFQSDSCCGAIYELNVFTVEDRKLVARNTQGVVKHRLPIGGDSDTVASLHVSGHHLVLAMKQGALRAWDLSRREPKLTMEKNLSQILPRFKEILQAQSNANATRISVIVTMEDNTSTLIILSSFKDSVKQLDLSKICSTDGDSVPQHDRGGSSSVGLMTIPESVSSTIEKEQASLSDQLTNGSILRCHWDSVDHRLLLVEFEKGTRLRRTNSSRRHSKQVPEMLLLSVFITDGMDVLLQCVTNIDTKYSKSLGCDAPCVYFLKQKLSMFQSSSQGGGLDSSTSSEVFDCPVERVPLRDFVGLEDCDPTTIRAITSFSYYSTIGNMDEAFKSIKTVKSKKVWETLATMCIKTGRLDVALVCLGNMGNARAAKAVREAQSTIPEHDARLAVLATQLGMLTEAEDLYRSSGRFDLLNQFYQACGRWPKAVEVAEVNDRMNLKSTYFNFAKHTEALGEIKPSLNSYERSEAPFEIMRMLNDDPNELEEYVLASSNSEVRHYWAEYLESVEDLQGAMLEYESCGDVHSQVRVLQLLNDIPRAIEVVEETRNKAAAYFLARHLSQSEELSDIQKAIEFFTLAHCYNPAIQLAKDHGLDMELMNLALMSTREDKVDVAKFYENDSEMQDKAIMLYHKAGELSKALELCFQYRQYEVLHVIAEELSEKCNPDMLKKVADFFLEQEQFDKAVDLFIRSNMVSEALMLCATHHIVINEDTAERMTPEKRDNESPEESQARVQLLEDLGDCLVEQGQWHLAAKKFTQAGDRIKAMKALLKSGDTDKIVYFANVSRQKEIYIMVANYLQSLDWRGNHQIMKSIIGYYTKGRALVPLANFYDTCAQVEIDEYQDYEKAHGALNEAVKCLKKAASKSQSNLDEKIQFFQYRADLIKKFADARSVYQTNPEQCIQECHQLLDDPKVDTALRTGDVFGLLITHYHHHQQYKEAYDVIEEMKSRIPGVNVEFYIDPTIIATVYTAQGIEAPVTVGNEDQGDTDDDDDEVIEEFEPEP